MEEYHHSALFYSFRSYFSFLEVFVLTGFAYCFSFAPCCQPNLYLDHMSLSDLNDINVDTAFMRSHV